MTTEQPELKEVFAGNIIEAGMIRSLLESEEIEAYLKDEIMGTMIPWYNSPAGSGSVRVQVAAANEEKAKQVIESYYQSMKEE